MKPAKPFAKWTEAERERALLLHRICGNISGHVAGGETVHKAIKRIVRRSRYGHFKIAARGKTRIVKLATSTMFKLFAKWKRSPAPTAFYRAYRPGKAPLPPLTVREFKRRCLLPKTPSIQQAFESMAHDWKAGKPVPGLGTWRTWARLHPPCVVGDPNAPAFPYSPSSFRRRFSKRHMRKVRKLRAAVESAMQSLADFKRRALESETRVNSLKTRELAPGGAGMPPGSMRWHGGPLQWPCNSFAQTVKAPFLQFLREAL